MMKFFTADAFTRRVFHGNSAAIVIAEGDIDDDTKQKLAAEFNLSETAFPEPVNGVYESAQLFRLRWFTPTNEVDLCGHATLATAHVIFKELGNKNKEIKFETKSGILSVVNHEDGQLVMTLPLYPVYNLDSVPALVDSGFEVFGDLDQIGRVIAERINGVKGVRQLAYNPNTKKLLVCLNNNVTYDEFIKITPGQIKEVDPEARFVRGVIITSHPLNPLEQGFGQEVDYVLRYFSPWNGILEDPATGSAQCVAAPFWAKILGKKQLKALQCYPGRGAEFEAIVHDEKLELRGHAVTVLKGHLQLSQ